MTAWQTRDDREPPELTVISDLQGVAEGKVIFRFVAIGQKRHRFSSRALTGSHRTALPDRGPFAWRALSRAFAPRFS